MYSNQSIHALTDNEINSLASSALASGPCAGVSSRYSFLPTIEIVHGMREAGWEPVKAFQQKIRNPERNGFQKHVICFQRREHLASHSEYRPEVVLVNSHDRSTAYQLHAGLFRLVCGNGMIIADTTFEHIAVRHSGEPRQIIDASFKVLDNIPQLTESVEQFRARSLTPAEQRAFAESAILLKYDDAETAPVGPECLLRSRRSDDDGNDLWNTFNRVQENLVRGGLKDLTRWTANGRRYVRTRPVTGIDENVKLNKALWTLAEALRKDTPLSVNAN